MRIHEFLPIVKTGINFDGYGLNGQVVNECTFTLYAQDFKFVFINEELVELLMNGNPITEHKFMTFMNLKVFW